MAAVILPDLGDGIKKAVVACWHCQVGDKVSAEDDVVEVVTDKATFNVPAGTSGTIKQIFVPEGQEANIGDSLAVIE